MVRRGPATSHPPLVILVEDDESLRQALSFSLPLEGFRVEVCASGEALLAFALPPGSRALVVDFHLPGIDGLKALAALRKRGVTLPAMLTTTHPSPAVRAAARKIDVQVVEKPLLDNKLAKAIRQALG